MSTPNTQEPFVFPLFWGPRGALQTVVAKANERAARMWHPIWHAGRLVGLVPVSPLRLQGVALQELLPLAHVWRVAFTPDSATAADGTLAITALTGAPWAVPPRRLAVHPQDDFLGRMGHHNAVIRSSLLGIGLADLLVKQPWTARYWRQVGGSPRMPEPCAWAQAAQQAPEALEALLRTTPWTPDTVRRWWALAGDWGTRECTADWDSEVDLVVRDAHIEGVLTVLATALPPEHHDLARLAAMGHASAPLAHGLQRQWAILAQQADAETTWRLAGFTWSFEGEDAFVDALFHQLTPAQQCAQLDRAIQALDASAPSSYAGLRSDLGDALETLAHWPNWNAALATLERYLARATSVDRDARGILEAARTRQRALGLAAALPAGTDQTGRTRF